MVSSNSSNILLGLRWPQLLPHWNLWAVLQRQYPKWHCDWWLKNDLDGIGRVLTRLYPSSYTTGLKKTIKIPVKLWFARGSNWLSPEFDSRASPQSQSARLRPCFGVPLLHLWSSSRLGMKEFMPNVNTRFESISYRTWEVGSYGLSVMYAVYSCRRVTFVSETLFLQLHEATDDSGNTFWPNSICQCSFCSLCRVTRPSKVQKFRLPQHIENR